MCAADGNGSTIAISSTGQPGPQGTGIGTCLGVFTSEAKH